MTDLTDLQDGIETKALGAPGALWPAAPEAPSDAEAAQTEPRTDALEVGMRELKSRFERLDTAVTRLHLASQRTPISTKGSELRAGQDEYAVAFCDRFLRKGLETGLAQMARKSMSYATPADGGHAVPEALDQMIEAKLRDISPIRAIASSVQVASADYRKLATSTTLGSGWVADNATRPETSTPTFQEIAVPMGELYANPAATQVMLDDAVFDVEAWLAEEIALEFAKQEGTAFITGNGTSRPKGFATYATAATGDAARAFGTLQHIATGSAGAFPASNPSEKLIDLVHALRPAFRQGAHFVMNSATLATIRKFKDADGNFMWRPSLAEGVPATLLGYPVIEAEDMPDVAANSLSIAFGNFKRGYVIAERAATRILRDPFSNKPFVHFYATRRLGGAVVNFDAIKLLKFSAS